MSIRNSISQQSGILATIAILMACLVSVSSTVNAEIIVSDDFSAEGSGTGWAAASSWGAGNVSGGVYNDSGSNLREFDATGITSAVGEFWVSMEVSFNNTTWGGISFYNGATEVAMLGHDTGHGMLWGIDGQYVTDTYSTIPIVSGQTYFMLGRFNYVGTDHLSLWIDPPNVRSVAALGTPDAETDDNNLGPYSQVRLGAALMIIDNLIIATTLSEVMPQLGTVIMIN